MNADESDRRQFSQCASSKSIPNNETPSHDGPQPPRISSFTTASLAYSGPRARRSTAVSASLRQPHAPSHHEGTTGSPKQYYRPDPMRLGAAAAADPPPALGTILAVISHYSFLYLKHYGPALAKSCFKLAILLLLGVAIFGLVFVLGFSVLAVEFIMESSQLCTPPTHGLAESRPLIEYYVHGRGKGHAARTFAILEDINAAGVDVRMFIGRAALWDFAPPTKNTTDTTPGDEHRGVTTAIAVTSLVPGLGHWASLSRVLERIMGDCQVAAQTKRYPLLVVTDGDLPGMFRAKFGRVPCVSVSHGQAFCIADKPAWAKHNFRISKAWDREASLNSRSSWFSSWQISTNFLPLDASSTSAAFARPPLRQEIKRLRQTRAQLLPLALPDSMKHRVHRILRDGADTYDGTTDTSTEAVEDTQFRKVVLCYWRDGNGRAVADALMSVGFDVIVIETGYNAMLAEKKDPHLYGRKWIIPEQDRIALRQEATLEASDEVSTSSTPPSSPEHRRLTTASNNSGRGEPRLIQILDRSLFVPLMSIVDGIAASAGSQTMSECIFASIPLLALHKKKDREQMLNVEMSRQARNGDLHKDWPVFGASLEDFSEIISKTPMLHLRSNGTSAMDSASKSKRKQRLSPGAKTAQTEFESFVAKIQASPVSTHYRRRLLSPATQNESATASMLDPADDPFRGMLEASGILLEIIKQVQHDSAR